LGKGAFRTRNRSVRCLTKKLHRIALRKGEEAAKRAGIRRVALPQSGRLTKKRKEYEGQRWFKRAFAFRAGVEGRISVLRRKYDLERCPYHGEDGMGRWAGWGIVVHNLAKISEKQAARQGR
jgi:IS5 family transposase